MNSTIMVYYYEFENYVLLKADDLKSISLLQTPSEVMEILFLKRLNSVILKERSYTRPSIWVKTQT